MCRGRCDVRARWQRRVDVEERGRDRGERKRERKKERESVCLSTINFSITCPHLRASLLVLLLVLLVLKKPLRRPFSSTPAGVWGRRITTRAAHQKFHTNKITQSVTVISISTSLTLTESRAAECQHTDNTETTHTFSASPTLLPRAQ